MLQCVTVALRTLVNLILSRFNCSLPHVEKGMYIWSFGLRAMDLNIPISHTIIHCKLKLYKTKVYLTHRHIKIRIENSYVGVLEAAFDSGSMVHAIVLTINSIFFNSSHRVLYSSDWKKSQGISLVKFWLSC